MAPSQITVIWSTLEGQWDLNTDSTHIAVSTETSGQVDNRIPLAWEHKAPVRGTSINWSAFRFWHHQEGKKNSGNAQTAKPKKWVPT